MSTAGMLHPVKAPQLWKLTQTRLATFLPGARWGGHNRGHGTLMDPCCVVAATLAPPHPADLMAEIFPAATASSPQPAAAERRSPLGVPLATTTVNVRGRAVGGLSLVPQRGLRPNTAPPPNAPSVTLEDEFEGELQLQAVALPDDAQQLHPHAIIL